MSPLHHTHIHTHSLSLSTHLRFSYLVLDRQAGRQAPLLHTHTHTHTLSFQTCFAFSTQYLFSYLLCQIEGLAARSLCYTHMFSFHTHYIFSNTLISFRTLPFFIPCMRITTLLTTINKPQSQKFPKGFPAGQTEGLAAKSLRSLVQIQRRS